MQDFLDNLDAELQSMGSSADQKTQKSEKKPESKQRPKHNISVKPKGHPDIGKKSENTSNKK